ncbi:MAG TPA: hypothetical protein VHO91_13470 [Rhodopila sp.]|nr:hypothetical protein [Rhodopila sp.]
MLALSAPLALAADNSAGNDYPTQARAEFVFACMASNGQTQQALRQCSCAIDVIASVLPYAKYEEAETVLRMRQHAGGYMGELFRNAATNNMVRDFQEAQAEGEIRCF